MKPAIRTQVDERQMEFSIAAGTTTDHLPDQARQEFREETDINQMLKKFGVNVPVQTAPQFGDVDFDVDLHSAHIARDRVDHAFRALSPELRKKYKTPAQLLDAMNSGELAEDLVEERDRRERELATERAKRERAAQVAAQGDEPSPPAPPPPPAPPAPPAGDKPPAPRSHK